MDAVINLTEIASYAFRQENIEFAVHSNKSKFNLIALKLELLLYNIKNEYSRYLDTMPNILKIEKEFSK